MSKLSPKKFSARQIKIATRLEKELNGWGFQHYIRYCEQPSKDSYGETLTVIEGWSNEDMADFIVTDLLKLTAPTGDKEQS